MSGILQSTSGLLAAAALACTLSLLPGCGSLEQMAHDQDVYNQNKCKQYGLTPGSPQYVQCISQGANAYGESMKNGTAAAPGAPAVAIWPGATVNPSSCSAPSDSDNVCAGCSVSCPAGKQASCKEGEVHKTDGFSPVCWTKSACECH